MKNIVVFASGSGTNFQAIIDAVKSGEISARIKGLIADKKGIGAIERARKNNIPVKIISQNHLNHKLLQILVEWDPDLIVLAGYLKKIPAEVIEHFEYKIINIHPSLLPKYGGKGFYGLKVHQAVIEANERESGCTVHYVTENYDEGPVIAQFRVDVQPNDTPQDLAKKILPKEHQLLTKTIKQLINP